MIVNEAFSHQSQRTVTWIPSLSPYPGRRHGVKPERHREYHGYGYHHSSRYLGVRARDNPATRAAHGSLFALIASPAGGARDYGKTHALKAVSACSLQVQRSTEFCKHWNERAVQGLVLHLCLLLRRPAQESRFGGLSRQVGQNMFHGFQGVMFSILRTNKWGDIVPTVSLHCFLFR